MTDKKYTLAQVVAEDIARRVAGIAGPKSGAAKALAILTARRAKGEKGLRLVRSEMNVLVVPESDIIMA